MPKSALLSAGDVHLILDFFTGGFPYLRFVLTLSHFSLFAFYTKHSADPLLSTSVVCFASKIQITANHQR